MMGICPRCGSWVDEGEPYCLECCYVDDDVITVNGNDYDADEVERVLRDYGYDLSDLVYERIGDDDMKCIMDDLNRY